MTLRRVLPTLCILAAVLITATPAHASGGGGGGGGGTTTPTTPAIQLAPDSTSLFSGSTEFVQVVLSGPAASATSLSITASSASVTVPASFAVDPTVRPQFPVTGNSVTAATPVTITVKAGTSSASFTLTVNPAPTPTLGTVDVFPHVVASGDATTVDVSLDANTPPGGVTVALKSDSPLLAAPASITIPAGQNLASFPATIGTTATTTIVHVTGTLGAKSVVGQVEIDPSRTLTGLTLSAPTADGAVGATGRVSISVPADAPFFVTLHSSNPAVASVPSTFGLSQGGTDSDFAITTTQVQAATPVTITASARGITKTATITITPTPPPPFDIQSLSVSPKVIAGTGTSTGTITTNVPAPAGGQVIKLSTSDTKLVSLPTTVTVPAGATRVTFPVKTTSQSGTVGVGISAVYKNQGPSALLSLTGAKGGTPAGDGATQQRLASESLANPDPYDIGEYGGGKVKVESGQMPPGVSLINDIRPGEFVFFGPPKAAGTYTFVIEVDEPGFPPADLAYVWVITP